MFFFKKRPKPSVNVDELYKEITKLKKTIQEMSGNEKNIEYHFHFDQVDIHEPTLEQLTFQLDRLDIEELSGALNMGNNFGVHVKPKASSPPELKNTKDGFKFTFKSKED
ncbi:hypothetical protein [Halobacillus litoralis]|uniref:hypothetical protein n=1 Tax=Halobacillus litoralis TaxID=45668 RepID=UPI002490B70B|nr:hypothetical protein [Halobacillus litoralis]